MIRITHMQSYGIEKKKTQVVGNFDTGVRLVE